MGKHQAQATMRKKEENCRQIKVLLNVLLKSESGQSGEKNIETIYETKMYELIFCKALPLATLMKCFNERCCWIISASLLLIWKLFPE